MVLISENGFAESRINDFVNENEKCVRQYFPFSYPEDYLEGSVDYLRHKVKASICASMQECEKLFYNPFDIDAQNSNRPCVFWDDCDLENDIDFRLIKSEIIIGASPGGFMVPE